VAGQGIDTGQVRRAFVENFDVFWIEPKPSASFFAMDRIKSASRSMRSFAFSSLILVMAVNIILAQYPASPVALDSYNPEKNNLSFQWRPAPLESLLGATLANAERFGNEQGTRDALQGPFFKDYLHDIENLNGWQDGDGAC
jgi:hypothetical protein